jgi:type II secretory pathway component GspD/PulD (secretin)
MKIYMRLLFNTLAMMLSTLLICSCVEKDKKTEATPPPAPEQKAEYRTVIDPTLLPNRFRQTGYMINEDETDSSAETTKLEDLQLKVGANISTKEPITLRDAMKALVKIKSMSLSWAPDVDQNSLVDIDVRASDNFYEAIDNILRQLDYFHEVEGSTIVIKYRETKKYHVAMPFVSQYYASETGSTTGSLKATSGENKFNQWEVIQNNIDKIIATWSASTVTPQTASTTDVKDTKDKDATKKDGGDNKEASVAVSRRVSSTDSTYTIDKPVGLITVNAPKSIQNKISDYLKNLEHELYKQIIIEAKIIEVQLNDSSSLGINWNLLLSNLSFDGLNYSKSKLNTRDTEDKNETSSSRDYSDQTNNTSSRTRTQDSSSSNTTSSGTDGSSNQNNSTTNTTEAHLTGTDTTLDNFTSTATGSNESLRSSSDSSTNSLTHAITDTLASGTSAATIISSIGNMSESIATGATLYGFNFTSFIKALQQQGQTSILSNPKISVLNGQPALIKVGKDITYISEVKTETTDGGGVSSSVTTSNLLSGIGLALSAVVKDDDEIIMNLSPMTSELSGELKYEEIGQGNKIGLPIVNKREMNTWVKIKNGSMLVVGGLISETESKDGNTIIPGTQDIPYLKYLFGYEEKSKSKSELIILLRPRIIN